MLTLEAARDEQFDDLLNIVYNQTTHYLEPKLDLIQATWEQFGQVFRTTGVVYCLRQDGELAGMCWVEECPPLLYLHGLVVKPEYRSQGIGRQALELLEERYSNRVEAIELAVHSSNPRAQALYERCGYQVARRLDPQGFWIMRKKISQPGKIVQAWRKI